MELPWYAQLGAHNNPQTIAASNTAAVMVIWAEKVGQNREWDHKPKILKEFNNDTRHKQGRYAYYYDSWSNIHYGYIGMAAGFSESVLLEGAGLEQIASETLVKAKNPIEKPWPAPSEGISACEPGTMTLTGYRLALVYRSIANIQRAGFRPEKS